MYLIYSYHFESYVLEHLTAQVLPVHRLQRDGPQLRLGRVNKFLVLRVPMRAPLLLRLLIPFILLVVGRGHEGAHDEAEHLHLLGSMRE